MEKKKKGVMQSNPGMGMGTDFPCSSNPVMVCIIH